YPDGVSPRTTRVLEKRKEVFLSACPRVSKAPGLCRPLRLALLPTRPVRPPCAAQTFRRRRAPCRILSGYAKPDARTQANGSRRPAEDHSHRGWHRRVSRGRRRAAVLRWPSLAAAPCHPTSLPRDVRGRAGLACRSQSTANCPSL